MTDHEAFRTAQAAFDATAAGRTYRDALRGYFAQVGLASEDRARFGQMRTTLAAMAAFDGDAFAGRALRGIEEANRR